MNLLAHAYLSFNDPAILAGNMMNDYVKGKKKFDYPQAIQTGMELHRAIDAFTDQHPATLRAMQFFKPQYRLYAGAFVDVIFDHFLANDPNEFDNDQSLKIFCEHTYLQLQQNLEQLHPQLQQVLPYMLAQDWLYNYRFKSGIESAFKGLVKRAAYLSESAIAFEIFNAEYAALKACYAAFFPELKQFATQQLEQLNQR